MEYAKLENTNLVVSRIGLGCEPLGGTDWGQVDESSAIAAVHKALDLGINLFDTADVYGLGLSESRLSQALGRHRHEVVIITKCGVRWRYVSAQQRAHTFRDSSPSYVVTALENSLRRLRIDCIPIYCIHWPDPNTPLSYTMEALLKCREQGKIRYIGLSNFSPDLVRVAHSIHPLGAVQFQYNLLTRSAEESIAVCRHDIGVSVIAYGVLAQGLLTGKYGPDSHFPNTDRRHRLPHFRPAALKTNLWVVERLREVAQARSSNPAQVAIRWVLDNPGVACAVVGAKTPNQVEANAAAADLSLTPEERSFLDDLRCRPRAPNSKLLGF
ncbi:MAG: aldo/keto reductase [Armatimonadota bacterium]